MKDLETCRKEIDEIDQQMIALFEKRMNVAKDVITYKLAHNMEIFQSHRELQVIEKNTKRIHNDDLKDYAKTFIQDMMNIVNLKNNLKNMIIQMIIMMNL